MFCSNKKNQERVYQIYVNNLITAIALSGNKGVLKAVDNKYLSDDTKKRHSKAIKEAHLSSKKIKRWWYRETLIFKLFMQECMV